MGVWVGLNWWMTFPTCPALPGWVQCKQVAATVHRATMSQVHNFNQYLVFKLFCSSHKKSLGFSKLFSDRKCQIGHFQLPKKVYLAKYQHNSILLWELNLKFVDRTLHYFNQQKFVILVIFSPKPRTGKKFDLIVQYCFDVQITFAFCADPCKVIIINI